MRRLIRSGIEREPRLQVVGEAGSARDARELVKQLQPDILTLDVEMPGMDGLEFLRRLMKARPMPVVMVSSLTREGSDLALQALSHGALDCVEKPRFGEASRTFSRLTSMLVELADAVPGRRPRLDPVHHEKNSDARHAWNGKTVLMGASTGGVEALETVFRAFPSDCPPTLVTQHMPAEFLSRFAARLNSMIAPTVRLARHGDKLQQGEILIAPGGAHHMGLDAQFGMNTTLKAGEKRSGHRPSVDELFLSAAPHAERIVAALLTGMGQDGARGLLELRLNGAKTFAQDEATCVVYGMPRVAAELGGVERSVPIHGLAPALLAATAEKNESMDLPNA
tara:strand:- start:8812 stop:9825 length:1014 start_codon:yes stop_codon:yes gene_type:complete